MGIKRTVLIRLIDVKSLKLFATNKSERKMQKTERAIFPLYFQGDSFIIFNRNVLALPEVLGP